MNFGYRLKKILKHIGMSQKKLAELTNTSEQMVGRYLKRDGEPTGKFIMSVLDIFPDKAIYLMFGDKPPENILNEPTAIYGLTPEDVIDEIEEKLKQLKELLAQK